MSAPSGGVLGFGAKFLLHNGTTLTEVADIKSVNRPNLRVDTVDVTTHGSPNGVREFIPGLADPGELSIKMLYEPGSAADTLLLAALAGRTRKAFKITLPTNSGSVDVTGTCVVTGYEPDDVPIDDAMQATLTAKVSGPTTQATSS